MLRDLKAKHEVYYTQQRDEAGSIAQRQRLSNSNGATVDAARQQQVELLRLYHISGKYYKGQLLDQVCAELGMPEPLAAGSRGA